MKRYHLLAALFAVCLIPIASAIAIEAFARYRGCEIIDFERIGTCSIFGFDVGALLSALTPSFGWGLLLIFLAIFVLAVVVVLSLVEFLSYVVKRSRK